MDENLNQETIEKGLETSFIGRKIFAFHSLQSTNETAKQIARNGAEEGSLVIAEVQTAGRGRHGRSWFSPEGGLWFSLILTPRIPPQRIPILSLITALSVVEAIQKTVSLLSTIRWPNDILIREKKVCGILSEYERGEEDKNLVIIGIGINVNQSRFPPELERISTSLRLELGRLVSRLFLLQEILLRFEENYSTLLRGDAEDLLKKVIGFSSYMGRRVMVDLKEKVLEGEVIDLDEDGRLILRLDNGLLQRVTAGEARLVR